jgi:hypothetical protein
MIICVQRFRTVKLVSPKNYEIRLTNKLERTPPPWTRPTVVMECNVVLNIQTLISLNTLSAV